MFKKLKANIKKAFVVEKKDESTDCQSMLDDPDILAHISNIAMKPTTTRGKLTDLEQKLITFFLEHKNSGNYKQHNKLHNGFPAAAGTQSNR